MAAPFFLLILLSALTCFSYIFSWLTYNRKQYWHKLCVVLLEFSHTDKNQFEKKVPGLKCLVFSFYEFSTYIKILGMPSSLGGKIDLFLEIFGNSLDVLSKTFWNLGLVPRAVLAAGWLKEGRRPLIRLVVSKVCF